MLIHGAAGDVATLCLDLDTSKAERAVVDVDAARIGSLLASSGLEYVEDVSPSGGRHLYVPLAERMPGTEARELVDAIAGLAPSPHQNPTTGCIRVPGSLHKQGGHQQLVTTLTAACGILCRRNPTAVAEAALLSPIAAQESGVSKSTSAVRPLRLRQLTRSNKTERDVVLAGAAA